MSAVPVSGFSFVRNAVKYGYPVAAALRSVAPLVDELVVAVGDSDDGTLELVRGLGIPQLRIIETVWDESLRQGGLILSQQTNVALAACRHPWALYIQADEVVHEDDHGRIRAALARWHGDPSVDALRFRFLHFEGTYAYVNYVRYRKQCRLVRNNGRAYWKRRVHEQMCGVDIKHELRDLSAPIIRHFGFLKTQERLDKIVEICNINWKADQEHAETYGLELRAGTANGPSYWREVEAKAYVG